MAFSQAWTDEGWVTLNGPWLVHVNINTVFVVSTLTWKCDYGVRKTRHHKQGRSLASAILRFGAGRGRKGEGEPSRAGYTV